MRVMRIENAMGLGPWSDDKDDEAHTSAHAYDDALGTDYFGEDSCFRGNRPCEDGIDLDLWQASPRYRQYADPNVLFGCDSLTSLEEWFPSPEGRQAMAERGMRVVEYDVPERACLLGQTQIAFKRDEATATGHIFNVADWSPWHAQANS